jgi:hypothetical protein
MAAASTVAVADTDNGPAGRPGVTASSFSAPPPTKAGRSGQLRAVVAGSSFGAR